MTMENSKAQLFIKRLMANPALENYPLLQKEEQIIRFLKVNAKQLYPTLASANFFPGKSWNSIYHILHQAIIFESNLLLFPELENVINSKIDFTFIHFLEERKQDITVLKKSILEFLKRILSKPQTRQSFMGPYTAILNNLPEPYLNESFERKKYIHFELTKVQKLKMGKEEVKNFILALLLLKPSVHLLTAGLSEEESTLQSGVVNRQFADKAFAILSNHLKTVPERLIRTALDSSLSFPENKQVEATSRITSIFAARGINYRRLTKVDRGADSPDKSWFNIARRNYKFYGFDINMLDEFYKIAAENSW